MEGTSAPVRVGVFIPFFILFFFLLLSISLFIFTSSFYFPFSLTLVLFESFTEGGEATGCIWCFPFALF